MTKIGFIGAGTVGTALAASMAGQGYTVAGVYSRSIPSAERLAERAPGCRIYRSSQEIADRMDLVFITTPDDAIPAVVSQTSWHNGQSVVHCSGADSTAVLEPARKSGAAVGCIHPLQTFASIDHAIENLPGSTFALEAEETLLGLLKDITTKLGGHWVVLKAENKVLYHASAVIACNYLVTLVKLATDLWQSFGISTPEATRALLPLVRGTVNNIENVGLPNCLTGPIARGDLGTIKKHLTALEAETTSVLGTYRELGRQTIPVSLAKGRITEERAKELQDLFASPAAPHHGNPG
ncbi:MAG: DUF2520 domain-containing protein [Dehalococcoidia bacterium]|nr:DUF2520 domain-containing protein [Dehalococcoidia bacterium]